jgi:hypothetical protein
MTDMLEAHAAVPAADVQRFAESLKQWRILHPQNRVEDVHAGRKYLLKNDVNHHFLHYKHQIFCAVNVGFSDDAEPSTAARVVHWEFVGRNGGAVKYNEPAALRCKDGYLRYSHRDCGINLAWSDSPVLEWRLYGGRAGAPVRTQERFCIFNEHGEHGEPLIYFRRELGGNIGWPSSKTLLDQGFRWATDVAVKAAVAYFTGQ